VRFQSISRACTGQEEKEMSDLVNPPCRNPPAGRCRCRWRPAYESSFGTDATRRHMCGQWGSRGTAAGRLMNGQRCIRGQNSALSSHIAYTGMRFLGETLPFVSRQATFATWNQNETLSLPFVSGS
jgi:hypothetical protein